MAATIFSHDDSWQLFRMDGSKVELASLHVTCYAHYRRKDSFGEWEPCRAQIPWEQFVAREPHGTLKEVVGEFRALAGNPPRLGERLVLRHAGHEVEGIVGGQGEAGPSQFRSTGGLRKVGWPNTGTAGELADLWAGTCAEWIAHGARIVRDNPALERVTLTDREPWQAYPSSGLYSWLLEDGRPDVRGELPAALFRHLPAVAKPLYDGLRCKIYDTRQAANAALNEACLNLARARLQSPPPTPLADMPDMAEIIGKDAEPAGVRERLLHAATREVQKAAPRVPVTTLTGEPFLDYPPLQIVTYPDPLSPEKRREIEGAMAQLKCGPLTILSDQPVTFERVTPEVLRRMAAHFSDAELAEAGLCRLDQPAAVVVRDPEDEYGPCQECRTRPAVAPIAHPVHGTYWVCAPCGDRIRNQPATVEGKG